MNGFEMMANSGKKTTSPGKSRDKTNYLTIGIDAYLVIGTDEYLVI
jgi:hypothetical protein